MHLCGTLCALARKRAKRQTKKGNDKMPSQHDPSKHQIAVKFPHRVWRQIEKSADVHAMTPSQYIRWVVTSDVEAVELTPEDAQLIADRIKAAKAKGGMV